MPLSFFTPKKSKENRRILVEDTPSPYLKKKKQLLTGTNTNNRQIQKIQDTPSNSQQQQPSQKKQAKKLFSHDILMSDDLPGFEANNERFVTRRSSIKSSRKSSIINVFKPKFGQTDENNSQNGCDASFETLKKRELIHNKKVVRLSQVLSFIDINDQTNNKQQKNVTNVDDTNRHPIDNYRTISTFNYTSFTNITKQTTETTVMPEERIVEEERRVETSDTIVGDDSDREEEDEEDDDDGLVDDEITHQTCNLTQFVALNKHECQPLSSTFISKSQQNAQHRFDNVLENYTIVDVDKRKFSNKKRFYITYVNLTKMQLKILKQIVKNNFNSNTTIEKYVNVRSTHLIIGNMTQTKTSNDIYAQIKVITAILTNCKIVKFDWAIKSSNENKWLNESEFLVYNDYRNLIETYSSMKFEQKPLKLFSNRETIYISNNLTQLIREQLTEIIIKCCGHVTSRLTNATIIIENDDYGVNQTKNNNLSNAQHIPIVSVKWIRDCVLSCDYELSFDDYLITYTDLV